MGAGKERTIEPDACALKSEPNELFDLFLAGVILNKALTKVKFEFAKVILLRSLIAGDSKQ